jgi:hypothetical protein
MSKEMCDRMGIEDSRAGCCFRGVPIEVGGTGYEGTIEVILAPLH